MPLSPAGRAVLRFEMLSYGGSECRLSAADDHRMEKQVTFVDEIGFERKCCRFGAGPSQCAVVS